MYTVFVRLRCARAGALATVALRPTVMYGEGDQRFVPSIMRLAHRFDQRIPKLAGAGGKQQLTYVGMCSPDNARLVLKSVVCSVAQHVHV